MYVAGHHTHKAGGCSLFHVPGTHAIHNKDGKYPSYHFTITLSVIVKSRQKLEAVCAAQVSSFTNVDVTARLALERSV